MKGLAYSPIFPFRHKSPVDTALEVDGVQIANLESRNGDIAALYDSEYEAGASMSHITNDYLNNRNDRSVAIQHSFSVILI